MSRVVLVGESWFTYSVHQKGFDAFYTSEYVEGGDGFIAALHDAGHEVSYIPTFGPARIHAMVRLRQSVRPPRALGGEGGPRLSTDLARPVSDR
jgi:hypothetical protein